MIDIIKPWVSQPSVFNYRWCWQLKLSKLDSTQDQRHFQISKISENDGHRGSFISTFTSNSLRLALTIKLIHSLMIMMWYLSFLTYSSASLITNLTLPFFHFSLLDWIFYTSYLCYRKTLIPTLHFFLKKASPQGLFLLCNPWASGNQTQSPTMTNQTFKSALTTGPVQTLILITRSLIQQEVDNNLVEIQDIETAERRWPKGIALGKLGVPWCGVCRQQGPRIGSGLHNLWYEWTLSPTRTTTPTQPPSCAPISINVSTNTRTMAGSIHRYQSSPQKNAHQRR